MDDEYEITISPAALFRSINQYHPRIFNAYFGASGPQPIPLSESTGYLSCWSQTPTHIDHLGKAVSIYFKLLKSLIVLMVFLSLLSLPLYMLYSKGEVSNGSSNNILSLLTLGNLGQT